MLLRWMTISVDTRKRLKDFKPIWIGADGVVIRTVKERHPGKSVGDAALPVESGGVVLMIGLIGRCIRGQIWPAAERLPAFPSRSDSTFLSFKMWLRIALTARCDEQGFTSPHNQFRIAPHIFGGVATFSFEASEHQGHPDHPPRRRLGGPATRPYRPPAVSAATGPLTSTCPIQAENLLITPLHPRQVVSRPRRVLPLT